MGARLDKRERLVAAARDLIHAQGLGHTTLADIAAASGVPVGNVYYYFKTKDELAASVIEARVAEYQALFRDWDALPEPRQRLLAFIDLIASLKDTLAARGCPVGGLCQELDKLHSRLSGQANAMLRLNLDWVTRQFRALGRADAEDLALHLISGVQGTSLLAHAFGDPAIVDRELGTLRRWVEDL